MKKIFLFVLLCTIVIITSAQTPVRDSLEAILSKTTVDTARVNLLIQMSRLQPTIKQSIAYSNEGLALAQKLNYKAGEASAMELLAGKHRAFGNYSIGLHYALSSLRIREQTNDTANMFRGYFVIGLVYEEMSDLQNALSYMLKAIRNSSSNDIQKMAIGSGGIGRVYFKLNKMDSALHYYQKSYEYYNLDKDRFGYYNALTGLGDLQFRKGNNELAIGYYREALQNCFSYADSSGYTITYDRMATFFDATQNRDSTIKYSKLTLQCAEAVNNFNSINRSATMLSKIYQNQDDKISLNYLQTAKSATDSLLSLQKSERLQSLLLGEKEKEKAEAELNIFNTEKDNQKLQYALMAIAIISFIIIFLLLSHSFITNLRVIGFLSDIALLLVFEFLNLLLHSFLDTITNHSPIIMLLGLVCIAVLLVPLHHKLDHWAKEKLVAKNKAVRLAAAKKTIEELGEKN